MKDKEDLERDIERGANAKKILNNPEFSSAFSMIKATLINGFENTKFDQSDERDEIWRKLQALNWLEDQIQEVINNGKMSEKALLEINQDKPGV